MKYALSLLFTLAACPKAIPTETVVAPLPYPASPRGEVTDTYHGVEVADPYRWLEDPDSPETRAWVTAQNELSSSWLSAIPEREALRSRLEAVWNYERFSTPVVRGESKFYLYNNGLQSQSVVMVQVGEDPPKLLLDPGTLSADGTVALSDFTVSRDGKYLAWGVSDGGSDWVTWKVREVATGQDTSDEVAWTKFTTASWNHDGNGFYYARFPHTENALEDANHNHALYYHRLGTPQSDDIEVLFQPEHPEWFYDAQVSEDGRWLVAGISRSTEERNLVWVRPAADAAAPWIHLIDSWDAEYRFLGVDGERLLFKSNAQAPRGKIVAVNPLEPTVWSTIIPESADTLEGASAVGGSLILSYLHHAHTRVLRYSPQGELLGEIALPGIGTAAGFDGGINDRATYFTYSDFITPPSQYRLDLASGAIALERSPSVDFVGSNYATEQVFFTSKDGTQVPMFLVHRKDIALDGTNPTLLYGYGGFNVSLSPEFSPRRVPWLELGGVFAVANLRGGGEYGAAWHEAGTLLNKQNVFDDFIGAATWLIDEGYTTPSRLAIEGGSNGGLLVGATLLQRPDLFGAALPAVGVMDMLRYPKFTIGWAWASDYGTADDPEQFKALYAYSPVHNARAAQYPAVLVTTGDHDDRVVPAHSYKFAAALQYAQQGPAPILARIETRAGHGAGKPTAMRLDEYADQLAFLVRSLQIQVKAP